MTLDLTVASARTRFAAPLFLATIVTGSFLLFLTQPMIARMALPRIGGAPAVWNSAMLVYQALLLAGYAYAHGASRLAPRRQAGLHLALFAVAALWLPIGLRSVIPSVNADPALWVPWFLLSSIGPLFFVISSQAPLMQRWYALDPARGDPYPLYAASNLGSFAGLISYPLLVEPLLTLEQQSLLWTGGYALLALLVAGCALTIPSSVVEAASVPDTPKPRPAVIARWILLAAVPSGLMLSTTTHLTTDIVAMPLLWALPLGLYLLSYAIAFAARRGVPDFITQIAPLIVLIAGGLSFADGSTSPFFAATLGLSLLFVLAVALHGELYRLRPAADHLTSFYLALSIGGALGGFFCAIVAPLLFDWAYEHPLLIVLGAFLLPQTPLFAPLRRFWGDPARSWPWALVLIGTAFLLSLGAGHLLQPNIWPEQAVAASIIIAVIAILCLGQPAAFAACVAALMLSYSGWDTIRGSMSETRIRSYFGVYKVAEGNGGTSRTLTHGTTLHGLQNKIEGLEREPTTYYGPRSGVGQALLSIERLYGPNAAIGIVGLGTGTLACYAKPGQDWRFFEIDPAVVRIATDPERFTFLSSCLPDARIILGDARIQLARAEPGQLAILAVDAFSSDAVPMHLLTREALRVYGRALRPDGLLLIHISNRYLDLQPVLAANARQEGWVAAVMHHYPDEREEALLQTGSVWVALSREPDSLDRLQYPGVVSISEWQPLKERPGFPGWSDDYATIIPLLKDDMLPWKGKW
jgi:SAM-dependent methyltransferase